VESLRLSQTYAQFQINGEKLKWQLANPGLLGKWPLNGVCMQDRSTCPGNAKMLCHCLRFNVLSIVFVRITN